MNEDLHRNPDRLVRTDGFLVKNQKWSEDLFPYVMTTDWNLICKDEITRWNVNMMLKSIFIIHLIESFLLINRGKYVYIFVRNIQLIYLILIINRTTEKDKDWLKNCVDWERYSNVMHCLTIWSFLSIDIFDQHRLWLSRWENGVFVSIAIKVFWTNYAISLEILSMID